MSRRNIDTTNFSFSPIDPGNVRILLLLSQTYGEVVLYLTPFSAESVNTGKPNILLKSIGGISFPNGIILPQGEPQYPEYKVKEEWIDENDQLNVITLNAVSSGGSFIFAVSLNKHINLYTGTYLINEEIDRYINEVTEDIHAFYAQSHYTLTQLDKNARVMFPLIKSSPYNNAGNPVDPFSVKNPGSSTGGQLDDSGSLSPETLDEWGRRVGLNVHQMTQEIVNLLVAAGFNINTVNPRALQQVGYTSIDGILNHFSEKIIEPGKDQTSGAISIRGSGGLIKSLGIRGSGKEIDVSNYYIERPMRTTIVDDYSRWIILVALGLIVGSIIVKMNQGDNRDDVLVEEYFDAKKMEKKLKDKKAETKARMIKADQDVKKFEDMSKLANENNEKIKASGTQQLSDIEKTEKELKKRQESLLKGRKPQTSKEILNEIEERSALKKTVNSIITGESGGGSAISLGKIEIGKTLIPTIGGVAQQTIKTTGDVLQTGLKTGEDLTKAVTVPIVKGAVDVTKMGVGTGLKAVEDVVIEPASEVARLPVQTVKAVGQAGKEAGAFVGKEGVRLIEDVATEGLAEIPRAIEGARENAVPTRPDRRPTRPTRPTRLLPTPKKELLKPGKIIVDIEKESEIIGERESLIPPQSQVVEQLIDVGGPSKKGIGGIGNDGSDIPLIQFTKEIPRIESTNDFRSKVTAENMEIPNEFEEFKGIPVFPDKETKGKPLSGDLKKSNDITMEFDRKYRLDPEDLRNAFIIKEDFMDWEEYLLFTQKVNPVYMKIFDEVWTNLDDNRREEYQDVFEAVQRRKAFDENRKQTLQSVINEASESDNIQLFFNEFRERRSFIDVSRDIDIIVGWNDESGITSKVYDDMPSGERIMFERSYRRARKDKDARTMRQLHNHITKDYPAINLIRKEFQASFPDFDMTSFSDMPALIIQLDKKMKSKEFDEEEEKRFTEFNRIINEAMEKGDNIRVLRTVLKTLKMIEKL